MTKRISLLALLALTFTLFVGAGIAAPQGEIMTYLPVAQRGNGYNLPDGNLLLYIRGYDTGSDLYITAPPPATPFQLVTTDVPQGVDAPLFSPDGAYILYRIIDSSTGGYDFRVMKPDGSSNFRLFNLQSGGISHPQWGPDARTIALASFPSGADTLVGYTVNIDSRDPITLATNITAGPIWDRDVMRLYYGAKNTTGEGESLMQINADGTEATSLFSSEQQISPVGVLPDGRVLVRLFDDLNDDLFLYQPSDDTVTQITFDAAPEGRALLSPNGEQILYQKVDTIYLTDNTGTPVWSHTIPCAAGHRCGLDFNERVWSPDGAELAFVWVDIDSQARYTYQLYTVATDGSQSTPTLVMAGGVGGIGYSPEGQYLTFDHKPEAAFRRIVIMDRSTMATTSIDDATEDLYFQAWRPTP